MTAFFRVELLPALHGDCILVEYGRHTETPHRILVDGGPIGAYTALEARIRSLPLLQRHFELLIITHVDADHIEGAIKLLNHSELGVSFGDIWFNGWPQLHNPLASPPPQQARTERSALQGQFMALRIGRRKWNGYFHGRAIFVPDEGPLPRLALPGGLTITLLGPTVDKLRKLRNEWDRSLRKAGLSPDDREETARRLERRKAYRSAEASLPAGDIIETALAVKGTLDDAVANGSSIALLAEFEGQGCALLGDAHMPTIEKAFDRLARERQAPRIPVQAIKLAHHGSQGNLTSAFLRKVQCPHYLISTDGSIFGHPDEVAISTLVQDSPGARLSFNYRTARTERWADPELQRRHGFQAAFPMSPGAGVSVDLLPGPGVP